MADPPERSPAEVPPDVHRVRRRLAARSRELDTLQELRLDDDSESDDDEHGPGPAEQQEMPGWRDD